MDIPKKYEFSRLKSPLDRPAKIREKSKKTEKIAKIFEKIDIFY